MDCEFVFESDQVLERFAKPLTHSDVTMVIVQLPHARYVVYDERMQNGGLNEALTQEAVTMCEALDTMRR